MVFGWDGMGSRDGGSAKRRVAGRKLFLNLGLSIL